MVTVIQQIFQCNQFHILFGMLEQIRCGCTVEGTEGWKSCTTVSGELCVITVSITSQPGINKAEAGFGYIMTWLENSTMGHRHHFRHNGRLNAVLPNLEDNVKCCYC